MIANILALLLLICGANSTYNASMAKNLAYVCACTFATAEEINNWTCKYCVYNNLTNTKAFNNSITDVFGFTAYSPSDDAVIISFRSSISIQNWVVNLDAAQVPYPGCSGCLVHQGFYNAYSGVEGYIRVQVQKLLSLYRNAKIFVTGYSLGSALATIAAADLYSLFGHVDQLYTYGQPRVGNEIFSYFITNIIPERYRVIHYHDLIPHLPPQIPLPYAHFANQVWYDKDMKTYKICGAQDLRCSKSVLPTQLNTNDHYMGYYIQIPV